MYEEYGARYESMLKEMVETSRTIPHWQVYERGIEALANTLAPMSGSDGTNKKGLTFADLLIKVPSLVPMKYSSANLRKANTASVPLSAAVC